MSKNELLQVGDVFTVAPGMYVQTEIPAHFAHGKRGYFRMVNDVVQVSAETDFLCGEYVVLRTDMTGGSTGRDPYPNGHEVTAKQVKGERVVRFYQTGCFRRMNVEVPVLRKAKVSYKLVIED